jgi:hypothetical protein
LEPINKFTDYLQLDVARGTKKEKAVPSKSCVKKTPVFTGVLIRLSRIKTVVSREDARRPYFAEPPAFARMRESSHAAGSKMSDCPNDATADDFPHQFWHIRPLVPPQLARHSDWLHFVANAGEGGPIGVVPLVTTTTRSVPVRIAQETGVDSRRKLQAERLKQASAERGFKSRLPEHFFFRVLIVAHGRCTDARSRSKANDGKARAHYKRLAECSNWLARQT